MKIVVISNYTSFPWDNGNSRFLYLINLLIKNKNNKIELITSSFFHLTKKQRKVDKEKVDKLEYKITTVYEPGYKKNVSLKRFYSNYILGKNLKKYLKNIEKPDIIYCAVPSLDMAKVAAKYAKKNNIRFIIDIQDLWPEAFKMVFNIPIISNILFFPMKKTADFIYSAADDIVAVSDTYVNRAMQVNKKSKNNLSVFLGTNLEKFDNVKKNNLEVKEDVIKLVYIGTLGHSYDLTNVINALSIIKQKGINNIKFLVMGSGPLQEKFESYAKEKAINCEFTGRLEYEKMVAKLCECDIAVNPIAKGAAQSIINKVGDYAMAGLPVVNTQENIEYRNLVETYNIGFNIDNTDFAQMADEILKLYNDKELREKLGKNNRKLAEEKFDRNITYKQIQELIEKE